MPKEKIKKVEIIEPLPIFEGDKNQQLQQLYDRWFGCTKCLLHQFRESPELVFADGNPYAPIMIVGEAPGEQEENQGIPFVGPSGQLLNQMLALISDDTGIQELSTWYDKASRSKENVRKFHEEMYEWRKEQFFITNIVCCKPPDNRQPTGLEIGSCFERVRAMVYIVDPLVIITVGKTAAEALLRKKIEITQKRGQLYEAEIHGRLGKVKYPVMPTLHPSYLLRKADWKVKDGDYMKTVKDLYKAMRLKDELMLHYFNTPIPERVEPK